MVGRREAADGHALDAVNAPLPERAAFGEHQIIQQQFFES